MNVNTANVKNAALSNDAKFISSVDTNAAPKENNGVQEAKGNSRPISVGETEELVKSLENYMNVLQTSIGFSVSKDTDRVVVTISNRETNEVIRQIPSEELVLLQKRMKELTGIIFSESV